MHAGLVCLGRDNLGVTYNDFLAIILTAFRALSHCCINFTFLDLDAPCLLRLRLYGSGNCRNRLASASGRCCGTMFEAGS